MYKKFYITTPEASKKLAEDLKSNPEQVAACKKRLVELESLLKLDENRCHASKNQRDYLRRMLQGY